jgi:hypothetical protein
MAKNGEAQLRRPRTGKNEEQPRLKLAKVSHTLHASLSERLKTLAFYQGVSESAVIEHALREFFTKGSDAKLGTLLRNQGFGRRRRHA